MNVTFKLKGNVVRFTRAITKATAETAEWFILAEEENRYVNTKQSITVDGNRVTVNGDRHALWADQFRHVMNDLKMAVDDGQAEVTSYGTRDRRLAWHETLESYHETRSTLHEWLAYTTDTTGRIRSLRRKGDAFRIPARFPEMRGAFVKLLQGESFTKLSARYERADLNGANALKSHLLTNVTRIKGVLTPLGISEIKTA